MRPIDPDKKRFISLAAIIAFSFLLGWTLHPDFKKVADYLRAIPLQYSGPAFIVLFVVGTFFLWYLHDPLYVIAALVFGAYFGAFFIYLAQLINAAIFFRLSRKMGKDYVEKRIAVKHQWIYRRLGEMSFGWLFLLRSVPVIPYRVLDLVFGLSKYSFRKYMLAAVLASPLRIFWMEYGIVLFKDFFTLEQGISFKNFTSVEKMMTFVDQNFDKIMAMGVLTFVYLVIAAVVFVWFRKERHE